MNNMGLFSLEKISKRYDKMKEKKDARISLRLNEHQVELLTKIVDEGKAKNKSAAIQLVLNLYQITDSNK